MWYRLAMASTEIYRWMNVPELIQTAKRPGSSCRDLSEHPDFRFSPFNSSNQIHGMFRNVYLRVVYDKPTISSLGWVRDPQLDAEAAWRLIRKDVPTREEDETARSGMVSAIRRIEIEESSLPEGVPLERVVEYIRGTLPDVAIVPLPEKQWRGTIDQDSLDQWRSDDHSETPPTKDIRDVPSSEEELPLR